MKRQRSVYEHNVSKTNSLTWRVFWINIYFKKLVIYTIFGEYRLCNEIAIETL